MVSLVITLGLKAQLKAQTCQRVWFFPPFNNNKIRKLSICLCKYLCSYVFHKLLVAVSSFLHSFCVLCCEVSVSLHLNCKPWMISEQTLSHLIHACLRGAIMRNWDLELGRKLGKTVSIWKYDNWSHHNFNEPVKGPLEIPRNLFTYFYLVGSMLHFHSAPYLALYTQCMFFFTHLQTDASLYISLYKKVSCFIWTVICIQVVLHGY